MIPAAVTFTPASGKRASSSFISGVTLPHRRRSDPGCSTSVGLRMLPPITPGIDAVVEKSARLAWPVSWKRRSLSVNPTLPGPSEHRIALAVVAGGDHVQPRADLRFIPPFAPVMQRDVQAAVQRLPAVRPTPLALLDAEPLRRDFPRQHRQRAIVAFSLTVNTPCCCCQRMSSNTGFSR